MIEETLIKHHDFALPGRKALLKNEREYEVVFIRCNGNTDRVSKKSKSTIIQARRKGTP